MSHKDGVTIILSGVNDKVRKVLEKNKFVELVGEDNICPNINMALETAKKYV